MRNYKLWKDEYGDYMCEVFSTNCIEIAQVQKELIEKGYFIINICNEVFGGCLMMLGFQDVDRQYTSDGE